MKSSTILRMLAIAAAFYIAICCYLYLQQEKIIFFPQKLSPDYKFRFPGHFTEKTIRTRDGNTLNGLLFTADSSKGLVFYLHGNAGSLDSWGEVASAYTALHYDVFILDYPGYGKSGGTIKNQQQLYDNVQDAYTNLLSSYTDSNIVILGYSIGTGMAAMLAAQHHPKMLILQAPYFNLPDMMRHTFPFLPTFLLKYKFRTNEFLPRVSSPVVLFHGDADEVIYYGSSLKLKELCKPGDRLITLKGQGHNGMTENPDYINALGKLLR
ncbi:MAG TPA: alpha/beta fold hydrolase [Chitinophagaceae bacterium]|nr:alpha/beta fold hydrolase [Chitinophagaceae bacterium]